LSAKYSEKEKPFCHLLITSRLKAATFQIESPKLVVSKVLRERETLLSSSDNPQFEPAMGAEPIAPIAADPSARSQPADPAGFAPVPITPPPAENPVWNGWDVLLIACLAIVTLLAVELLTVITAWLTLYRGSNLGDVMQKPVLAIVGEFLSYIAVAVYMIMLVEGKYRTPFGRAIRWNWPGRAALGMLGLGVFTVSLDLLSRFLPMPKTSPFDQFFERPTDAYLIAVFAVTCGPLMEELFFRGLLYPVLARRLGAVAGVVLTALPFGFMHYFQYKSWAAVLVITLVGVVLTTVRAVTKSVAASFMVHAGYNGTLMLLAAVATDGFRHMENAALVPFWIH
jgi:membrane protease YdiL (CAAX protease family)